MATRSRIELVADHAPDHTACRQALEVLFGAADRLDDEQTNSGFQPVSAQHPETQRASASPARLATLSAVKLTP